MLRIKNCTLDEFEEILHTRKIICFGAGQKFYDLCKRFEMDKYLYCIIDNHAKADSLSIGDISIPVKTATEVQYDDSLKQCVIVISSLKYCESMISQLDEIPAFDEVECYIPDIMKADNYDMPQGNEKPIIPKIIHYFWFGSNEIPKEYQRNIDTWKKFCPDYEFKKWDESNYDITKNKYMLQAYEAKKWGFVPDYARLDVVNTYGGIYLDTDVEMLRNWDELLYYNMFFGFESSNLLRNHAAFGLGFGSRANNHILQEMMQDYDEAEFRNDDGTLNLIASPVYQTKILEKHGLITNGKTQSNNKFVAFSPEYLSPLNFCGYGKVTEKSFSIHQYAATWMDKKDISSRSISYNEYMWIDNRIHRQGGMEL